MIFTGWVNHIALFLAAVQCELPLSGSPSAAYLPGKFYLVGKANHVFYLLGTFTMIDIRSVNVGSLVLFRGWVLSRFAIDPEILLLLSESHFFWGGGWCWGGGVVTLEL